MKLAKYEQEPNSFVVNFLRDSKNRKIYYKKSELDKMTKEEIEHITDKNFNANDTDYMNRTWSWHILYD